VSVGGWKYELRTTNSDAILYVQLKVFSSLSDAKGGRRFGVSLRGCP
jgi:hypothetical protein